MNNKGIKILFAGLLAVLHISVKGQVSITNNAVVSTGNGAIVSVRTMDLNNSGHLNHAGLLEIEGSMINNDSLICANNLNTEIWVGNNWTNNKLFNSGNSKVTLTGVNQSINGSAASNFHRLQLDGASGAMKTMEVAVGVADSLQLGNTELATQSNNLSLGNGTIEIERGSGYISNQFGGKVLVNMPAIATSNIEIPLGYSISDYKPVTLQNPSIGSYEFGLYGNNPTANGLNENNLQDSLCSIQNEYFYWVRAGASGLNYNLQVDGSETDLTKAAVWDGNKWTKLSSSQLSGSSMQVTKVSNQSNYVALAKERPFASAGNDIIMRSGNSVEINGSGYKPSTAFINWTPNGDLSCSDCFTPTFTYGTPGKFAITIDNGPNCMASDTMELIYWREKVFIENAFSPNDDDLNDVFAPKLLANEKLTMMEIYNRWGQKIYEGTEGWDGRFKGEIVQQGLYIYHLSIDQTLTEGTKHIYNTKGTLTILR